MSQMTLKKRKTVKQLDKAIKWHQQGRIEKAEKVYRNILSFHPNNSDSLNLLGLIEYQRKDFNNAYHLISHAIRSDDKKPDYHNNLGTVLKAIGQIDEARKSYATALYLNPNCANTAYNLAGLCLVEKDIEKAIEYYQRAVSNKSDYFQAYINLSAIYNQQKKYDKALECAQKGLQYAPKDSALINNMGNALKGLGEFEKAIEAFKKTIELDPKNIEGFINLGDALQNEGKLKDALHCYQKAINLDSNNTKIYNNLGTLFKSIGQFDKAIESFQTAIQLNPESAFPYYNMGNVFLDLWEKKKAAKCLEKAISLDPNLVEAHISLGIVLQDLNKGSEAIECFKKAITLNPDYPNTYALIVKALQNECHWEELIHYNSILDDYTRTALEKNQKPDEVPFLNLTRHCDPHQNYMVAKAWSNSLVKRIEDEKQEIKNLINSRKYHSSNKITIGYLSNNFRNHATTHLIQDLFKYHDRNRFNIYCYSYGINDSSVYRQQIENDCDRFVDIMSVGFAEAARQISNDKVDILVDLVGQMKSNRLEIPALKPAPIQVRWLGMAGTSGADFFDYIITDSIVTPEDQAKYYTETFAYMPKTYQVNSNKPVVTETKFDRKDFGLPEKCFIYASFCSTYKIDKIMYKIWMAILKRSPDSLLWLLEPGEDVQEKLKLEARNNGVDSDRIIFAKKMDRSQHLARISLANLCLDTRIVNGAATTSDALWAVVPVLTKIGNHFASRMAASILSAMELPELIVDTLDDYVDLAVKLAKEPEFYIEIRNKVNAKKTTAALFNTSKFVENLENLYQQMWQIYTTAKKRSTLKVIE